MSWIKFVERGLFAGGLLLVLVLSYLWIRPAVGGVLSPTPAAGVDSSSREALLPQAAYDSIGAPLLNLRSLPPSIQIPDLRPHIQYQGRNSRPDLSQEELVFHISLRGGDERQSVRPGQAIFLRYLREKNQTRYVFSEDNQETGLWVEVAPVVGSDKDLLATVGMKNASGEEILEPGEFKTFIITPNAGSSLKHPWSLGEYRVDASLLARMRVRWYGQDRFLEWHGGDDYGFTVGKERLDFGEGASAYACYAGEGDVLIWKNDRWEEGVLGAATQPYPMLQIKKISDRVMNLEIWDVEGPNKTALTLVKSRDMPTNQITLRQFKFVGAKTHSQAILEVNQERLLLQKHDWLVLDKTQWRKMESVQDIDDFVARKERGELFVYDGISRKDGRQVLTGHVFNGSRTEVVKLEFALGGGVEAFVEGEDGPAAVAIHQEEPPRSPVKAKLPNPVER